MRIDEWMTQADPRQIDALVATKVMGKTGVCWFQCYRERDCGTWQTMADELLLTIAKDQWSEGMHPCYPARELDEDEIGNPIWYDVGAFYSTERDALWEIVDRFDSYKIEKITLSGGEDYWSARAVNMSEPHNEWGFSDISLNHAIIVAALKAVGVTEVNDETE